MNFASIFIQLSMSKLNSKIHLFDMLSGMPILKEITFQIKN